MGVVVVGCGVCVVVVAVVVVWGRAGGGGRGVRAQRGRRQTEVVHGDDVLPSLRHARAGHAMHAPLHACVRRTAG